MIGQTILHYKILVKLGEVQFGLRTLFQQADAELGIPACVVQAGTPADRPPKAGAAI